MTNETQASKDKKTVFFISPIGEEGSDARRRADQTYKHLVRKALSPEAHRIQRADEDNTPGNITPRLVTQIVEADLVIADLSGFNPNVFYELAIAHGHHRPVVHMQRADEKLAFDVKDMRTIRYALDDPDRLETAVADLRAQAKAALDSPDVIETPLTAAGKFKSLEQSVDPAAEVAERLAKIEKALTPTRRRHPGPDTLPDAFAVSRWIEVLVTTHELGENVIENLKANDTSPWFDKWVDNLLQSSRAAAGGNNSDPWAEPPTQQPAADPLASPSQSSNDPWAAPGVNEEEPPF